MEEDRRRGVVPTGGDFDKYEEEEVLSVYQPRKVLTTLKPKFQLTSQNI